MLDAVATRYGKRPSELLGIKDPWHALDLDIGLAMLGIVEQVKAQEKETKAIEKIQKNGKVSNSLLGSGNQKTLPEFKGLMSKMRRLKIGNKNR